MCGRAPKLIVSTTSWWSSSWGRPETATVPMQPSASQQDRERTAVGREARRVEPGAVVEGLAVHPELLADPEGRVTVAIHDRTLARQPRPRCRPRSREARRRTAAGRSDGPRSRSAARRRWPSRGARTPAPTPCRRRTVEDEPGLLSPELVEKLASAHAFGARVVIGFTGVTRRFCTTVRWMGLPTWSGVERREGGTRTAKPPRVPRPRGPAHRSRWTRCRSRRSAYWFVSIGSAGHVRRC